MMKLNEKFNIYSFFVIILLIIFLIIPNIPYSSSDIEYNSEHNLVSNQAMITIKQPDEIAPLSSRDILKWSFPTTEGSYISTPALVDLTGDGELEIVFISDAEAVYAITNSGGFHWKNTDYTISRADEFMSAASGWWYLLPIFSSVTPADILFDDNYELLFGAGNYLVCLDANGDEQWKAGESNRFYISTPAVTDVDGFENATKEDQEIIVLKDADYRQMWPEIFYSSGLNLWTGERPSQAMDFGINSGVVVADLDGSDEPDGRADLIFGNRYSPIRLYSNDGTGYSRIIPTNTFVQCLVYGTGAVGDFVGDDELEYFIGTYEGNTGLNNPNNARGAFYLYDPINATAAQESQYRLWRRNLPTTGTGFLGSPAVGDVHCGNPSPTTSQIGYEGFLGSYDGNLYCIDLNTGDILWSFDTGTAITNSPALCNINLDKSLEVIVASNNGIIYCLDGDPADGVDEGVSDAGGTSYDILWQYDTSGNGFWVSSPVVADIDKDNNLEVVIGDRDGTIFCLNAGGTPVPGQSDWPMFQHDVMNTGMYPTKHETFDIELEVIEVEDTGKSTCYAKYQPYTFRATVKDGMGFDELKNVILTIDPEGYDIQCRWSQVNDIFEVVNDPNNAIELISNHFNSTSDNKYTWTIDFKIIFNWTFDSDLPIACSVQSIGYVNPTRSIYLSDFITVENNLEFHGALEVSSEERGTLNSGDWVQGGEVVHWSNITVVYKDTEDVHPKITEYLVLLSDGEDNSWTYNLSAPNEMLDLVSIIPEITDPGSTFILNLTNIPAAALADGMEYEFILRIDSTPPEPPAEIILHADSYSDAQTEADNDQVIFATWTSSNQVLSGIKGYYYYPIDISGTGNGIFTTNTYAEIDTEVTGLYDLHVWAVDNVGNIGTANHGSIHIDTEEITYILPQYPNWFNNSLIKIETTIMDQDGIGIDPTSIQYSILSPGSEAFGPWTSINQATDLTWQDESHTNLKVKTAIYFQKSGYNYIHWRAKDLAGNGYTISNYMRILVDAIQPTFTNPDEIATDSSDKRIVSCNITILDDGGSGINTSTIQYKFSTAGVDNYTVWQPVKIIELYDDSFILTRVTLSLKYGSNNYIRWRAMDIAGNDYSESEDIRVTINSPPVIIITSPINNTKHYFEDLIEFDAQNTYDPDETDKLAFYWFTTYTSSIGVQLVQPIGHGATITTTLVSGSNLITVYVNDGNYNISKSIFLFVYDKFTDLDKDGMPDWWEVQYVGLDPNNPLDANSDLDEDGTNNLDEYLGDTNPANPQDYPGKGEGEEEEKDFFSTLTSNMALFINVILLIIVIILLLTLFLVKRARIKKARLKELQATSPAVLLKRGPADMTLPGRPRTIGTPQMLTQPGALGTAGAQPTQVQVAPQTPVPQLPPHYPTQTTQQPQTQPQTQPAQTTPTPSTPQSQITQTQTPSQPQPGMTPSPGAQTTVTSQPQQQQAQPFGTVPPDDLAPGSETSETSTETLENKPGTIQSDQPQKKEPSISNGGDE